MLHPSGKFKYNYPGLYEVAFLFLHLSYHWVPSSLPLLGWRQPFLGNHLECNGACKAAQTRAVECTCLYRRTLRVDNDCKKKSGVYMLFNEILQGPHLWYHCTDIHVVQTAGVVFFADLS